MRFTPRYTCNEQYFSKIDTHEKAYILGFLWADGHNNPRSGLQISLQNRDIEVLENIKKELESNAPIKIGSKYSRFSINRKTLFLDLLKLGMFTNKSSNNLQYPLLDKELNSSFLLGIFDGDGSIWKKENTFSGGFSGGFSFLKEIEKILNTNEIQTNPIRYRYGINRPASCMMDISGLENIFNLYNFLYKNTKYSLTRKKEKFIESNKKWMILKDKNILCTQNHNKIYELYNKNTSQIEISRQLNIKYSTVKAIIQRNRRKQNEL